MKSAGFCIPKSCDSWRQEPKSPLSAVTSSSAAALINNVRSILRGACYTRAMSTATTDDFLTWIGRDEDPAIYAKAVSAVDQHIDYYTGVRGVKLPKYRDIVAKHTALLPAPSESFDSPEEIPPSSTHLEGSVRQVLVSVYERNSKARDACKAHYGSTCSVCGFDFGKTYGELGNGFIHVHHLKEISSIAREYEVDPIKDLRPVCPNCHAMLHASRQAISIEKLQQILTKQETFQP